MHNIRYPEVTLSQVLNAGEERNICRAYPSAARAEEHEELYKDIMMWVRATPNSATDSILNILLSLIMLFSPDVDQELEDEPKVRKIQDNFLKTLQRYLSTAYPDVSTIDRAHMNGRKPRRPRDALIYP